MRFWDAPDEQALNEIYKFVHTSADEIAQAELAGGSGQIWTSGGGDVAQGSCEGIGVHLLLLLDIFVH